MPQNAFKFLFSFQVALQTFFCTIPYSFSLIKESDRLYLNGHQPLEQVQKLLKQKTFLSIIPLDNGCIFASQTLTSQKSENYINIVFR